MLDHLFRAGAEATSRDQSPGQTADNHVHVRGINVLHLGHAAACGAQDAVGPGLVEDDAEFVLVLEADDLGEVDDVADVLEEALCDDEAAGEGLLGLLADEGAQDPFEVRHVVVLVPSDCAAGDLEAFAHGVVDGFVGDDNVASLCEGGDHGADGAEGLRVDDAGGRADVGCDVCFQLAVDVLRAVEAGGTAWADTVGAEGLDCTLFEGLIVDEVEVVVGREVCHRTAIAELALGAGGSDDYRPLRGFGFFEWAEGGSEGLGHPVVDKFVNFLVGKRDLGLCFAGVRWAQEVEDGEEEKEQLDGGAYGVVLVRGADIPDYD